MTYKGYFPIFNKNINERFQEFNNISSNKFNLENKAEPNSFSINDFPQKPKTLNVNKNSINSINKKVNKNEINSINIINQKLKTDINHFPKNEAINLENSFDLEKVVNLMEDEDNDDDMYYDDGDPDMKNPNTKYLSNDDLSISMSLFNKPFDSDGLLF